MLTPLVRNQEIRKPAGRTNGWKMPLKVHWQMPLKYVIDSNTRTNNSINDNNDNDRYYTIL